MSSSALPPIRRLAPLSGSADGDSTSTPIQSLKGAVCIITGVSSAMGIGRATAHVLAAHGARALYLCDMSSKNMDAIRSEILAAYSSSGQDEKLEVHTRLFDAADEKAVKGVVDDAVTTYGRLDVFYANAGISNLKPFTQITEDEFMKMMRTNVLSVFLAIKHAAPAMARNSVRKGGSIIATASVAGLRSNAGAADYSAAKAAVINLVQTTAFQLTGTGVRVNAVLPGLIETGMTEVIFEMAKARGTEKRLGQLNPTARAGNADEIARVVAFLASDEASYVNGQAWAVDGGLSAGLPFVPGKLA